MLKVVIYDCGYGGELLADWLEAELPILEIIRVIDWRSAHKMQSNSRDARKIAEADLRPYVGRVDLIILANHLLAITSLKYFRRKYKSQRFIGLNLKKPTSPPKDNSIILTTKAVTKTINYHNFVFHLRRRTKTVVLDTWPAKIDDGELTMQEIRGELSRLVMHGSHSQEVFLICSQFCDIEKELVNIFGRNLKIHDGFNDMLRETCKVLRLRGSLKKLK